MSVVPQPFPGHDYPQRLPEVDNVQEGGPPPWQGRDLHHRPTREQLRQRLASRGLSLDVGMPEIDDTIEGVARLDAPETRISAVLACLYEDDGELHLVFPRRAAHLRPHRHEVSLPGGRCEPGEIPLDTAVREAFEEIGLERDTLSPLGFLTPIYTLASSSAIWPVVAFASDVPEFRIDTSEVDRAFSVPIGDLLHPDNFAEQRWWRESPRRKESDGAFRVHFYRVPGDLVWGATARIVTELLTVITEPIEDFRR